MSSEDPRLQLLRQIPEWRRVLDSIEWTSDTRSQLESVIFASHGLRPLLRSDAVIGYLATSIVIHDDDHRGELAQDMEYARDQVRQALSVETDPALCIARLHMAEALVRHIIGELETAVT
jgi:hypothetical protein